MDPKKEILYYESFMSWLGTIYPGEFMKFKMGAGNQAAMNKLVRLWAEDITDHGNN
jgi:hypothetical protein